MYQKLQKLYRFLDGITDCIGGAVSWLSLLLMAVTFVVVVLRYALESSSIAMQESISYLHATLFLMGIAYTLKRGEHVRVDVFYRRFSAKTKAWVDLLGGVFFLMPLAVLLLVFNVDYVSSSWEIKEASKEPNGLPWVYVLKSLLLVMPVSVLIQALSEVIRNGLIIVGFEKADLEPHHEVML